MLYVMFQSCEVVRPLIQLLGIDRTAIQNFEALMALTNLAAMSDTVRYVHSCIVTTASFEPFICFGHCVFIKLQTQHSLEADVIVISTDEIRTCSL